MSAKARRRLARRLQEIRDEGQGVLKVAVILERDAYPLLAAAAAGNIEAQRRVLAVEDFIQQIGRWKPPGAVLSMPAEALARGDAGRRRAAVGPSGW